MPQKDVNKLGKIEMSLLLACVRLNKKTFKKREVILERWQNSYSGGRVYDYLNGLIKNRYLKKEIFKSYSLTEKARSALSLIIEVEPNDQDELLSYTIRGTIDHLNYAAKTLFRKQGKVAISKITARYNEGYRLRDFKAVIDKKVAEWKGTKMEPYLRPETLFGPKFEGYLNQQSGNLTSKLETYDFDKFFS